MAEGDVRYEDTTGQAGVLLAGGVEWMQPEAACGTPERPSATCQGRVFSYGWLACGAGERTSAQPVSAPQRTCLKTAPARVMLGATGAATSAIAAQSDRPISRFNWVPVSAGDTRHLRATPGMGGRGGRATDHRWRRGCRG